MTDGWSRGIWIEPTSWGDPQLSVLSSAGKTSWLLEKPAFSPFDLGVDLPSSDELDFELFGELFQQSIFLSSGDSVLKPSDSLVDLECSEADTLLVSDLSNFPGGKPLLSASLPADDLTEIEAAVGVSTPPRFASGLEKGNGDKERADLGNFLSVSA